MKNNNCLTDTEIKQEELRILRSFDAFCKERGLRYSLAFGTLLGAVRHQGFIPWDDDIDVCMPRPDYEMLLSLAEQLEGQFGLRIASARGDQPYPIPFSKVVDPAIQVRESSLAIDLDESLWIDVFPVDGVQMPDTEFKKLLKAQWNGMRMLGITLHRNPSCIKEMAQRIIRRFSPSPLKIAKAMDDALRVLDFSGAAYVSFVAGSNPGSSALFEKQRFLETVPMAFEGKEFPVMACWKEHLTSFYGDYMQLPPPNQRFSHGVNAWRRTPEQKLYLDDNQVRTTTR